VTFTQGQKDAIGAMVEMGDVAGAQALILAELESEFGGAAEAAGETTAGQFAKLKNETSELAEELGTVLLPVLSNVATGATDLTRYWRVLGGAVLEGEMSFLEFQRTGYEVIFTQQTMAGAIDETRGKLEGQNAALVVAHDNTEDYGVRLGDLIPKQQDFNTDLSNTKLGYENAGAAANGYVAALDPLLVAQDALTVGMKAYNDQLLFQIASEGLSAEQKLVLATHMGLLDERSLLAADSVAALTKKYDANHDGIISNKEATSGYIGELLHLQNRLDAMQDKTVTFRMVTEHVTVGTPGNAAGQFFNQGGQAAGGPTSDFGSGPRWVGEQGPEIWVPPMGGGFILNNQDAMAAVSGAGHSAGDGGGDNPALMAAIQGLPAAVATAVRDAVLQAKR
jgi:hypothetical protein